MFKRLADIQLRFIFGHSESTLRHHLEESLNRRVSLVLTENSTSMLSARIKEGVMCVRLHRMFLGADDAVIDEIVSMLQRRKNEMRNFRSFVKENRSKICNPKPRRIKIEASGKHHDLKKIFGEINEEYFDGAIKSAITWGFSCSSRAVRKRTLGSYSRVPDIIRINPVLDKRSVPGYFVSFVVYHEMLHAAVGTVFRGGRRLVHSKEFKKREKLFRDFERAVAWEKQSLA